MVVNVYANYNRKCLYAFKRNTTEKENLEKLLFFILLLIATSIKYYLILLFYIGEQVLSCLVNLLCTV